jgi:hypothetical protein
MYNNITQEQFDKTLRKILRGINAETLITLIPSIYPDVAEYLNNEVLDCILEERRLKETLKN